MITKLKWITLGFIFGLGAAVLFYKWIRPFSSSDQSKIKEITAIAQEFIRNNVSQSDSLNFRLFSDSVLAVHKLSGISSPVEYHEYMKNVVRLDSATILGVVLVGQKAGRVFVRGYSPYVSIYIYKFIKQPEGWKFNGFEVEYEYD